MGEKIPTLEISTHHALPDKRTIAARLARRAPRPRFCRSGFARCLRAAFPTATANNVAYMTGVPASTVDKWLRGDSAPTADHLAVMFSVFGPTLLGASYPACADWAGKQETLPAQQKTQKARCNERVETAIAELQAAIAALAQ